MSILDKDPEGPPLLPQDETLGGDDNGSLPAPPVAPLLRLERIERRYGQGSQAIDVLAGVSLAIFPGEVVALVGPSGAGKSTLLHIAGLLEPPTTGEVVIGGLPCSGLSDGVRTSLRRKEIGFVYQFHHLLPEFTAAENLVIPQMIAGMSRWDAEERAVQLLHMVGLEDRASHRPGRLSGGEQQRVAIVRAMANAPRLLLADEPTGNLDLHTAETVFTQLVAIIRGAQLGALIATHNLDLAFRMDRVLELRDGKVVQR